MTFSPLCPAFLLEIRECLSVCQDANCPPLKPHCTILIIYCGWKLISGYPPSQLCKVVDSSPPFCLKKPSMGKEKKNTFQ